MKYIQLLALGTNKCTYLVLSMQLYHISYDFLLLLAFDQC